MPLRRFWPAILAACSVALLAIGARLDIGHPSPPVPSEATVLERRLLSDTGSDMADALYGRAVRFANQLTWVASAGASGVRWESSDTVLTTTSTGTPPVQTVRIPGGGAPVHDLYRGELRPGEWLVAVARTLDGRLLWTAGMYGGKTERSCGGATFGEVHISAPLMEGYAGAALIDSNGRFVGMVVRCGETVAAMSVDGISRALLPGEAEDLNQYGYRAGEIPDDLRRRFDRRASRVVLAVRDGSAAGRAGLRPGDALAEPDPDASGILTVYRDRRPVQLRVAPLHATARGLEMDSQDGALLVASVQADSAAEQAGIRPGDLIVRVGDVAGDPDRLLGALEGRGPTFVVYRRADREIGVFLP